MESKPISAFTGVVAWVEALRQVVSPHFTAGMLTCTVPLGHAHTCPPTRSASGIIMAGGARECRKGEL